jgi:hypothetical protein
MKLQVTESQLKLIEQQQLNELKWLANVQSHIVKKLGYVGTGRKYGVSDNAIRKWCKIVDEHYK